MLKVFEGVVLLVGVLVLVGDGLIVLAAGEPPCALLEDEADGDDEGGEFRLETLEGNVAPLLSLELFAVGWLVDNCSNFARRLLVLFFI